MPGHFHENLADTSETIKPAPRELAESNADPSAGQYVIVNDDGLYLTALGSWTFSWDRQAAHAFATKAYAEVMANAIPPAWGIKLTVLDLAPWTMGPTKPPR